MPEQTLESQNPRIRGERRRNKSNLDGIRPRAIPPLTLGPPRGQTHQCVPSQEKKIQIQKN